MKNRIFNAHSATMLCLCVLTIAFSAGCEGAFEFDLPEANSKPDTVLPTADFSYVPSADDYRTVEFKNLSFESTTYLWDFGNGNTSTEVDPEYTFAGEGTFSVSLTASDANGASDLVTLEVEVEDLFVAIQPEILNADFEDGQNDWKFSSFTGGTTSPYNSSSDGSWLKIDGSDNGSKTRGAKWTKSTSAGSYVSSNTRYAYQSIVVSPNIEYVLEYEYAVKTPEEQSGVAPGGNRIVGVILDGQFDDGADAITSYDGGEGALVNFVGTQVLGKTTFTTVQANFTSNASGQIAILIYGVTDVDAYVDNVKVYPKN
ncbi:PKD domain-containing protein [Roseivirga sp.]|uniref:PKD domain-containing protein n=1 Tax=Roseivirga sp. TaxID=1964215 RepID=UPI003B8C3284